MNIGKPKIIAGAIGLVMLLVGANYGQFEVVEYGLRVEAARKADHWVQQFFRKTPDYVILLSTKEVSAAHLARLQETAEFRDIFHYQLYGPSGRLVVDQASGSPAPNAAGDALAQNVLRSGKAITSVGSPDQLLADTLADTTAAGLTFIAKVILPIRRADGSIAGVALAHVDQSEIRAAFQTATNTLSIILSSIFTAAFGGLFIGFVVARKREGKSRRHVDFLAKYDQLSHLYNRAGFKEKLEANVASGAMDPARMVVIFLDIDHFKHINDTYGHKAGDGFLNHVGQTISRCLQATDFAGRFGGDEFVIVAQRNDLAEAGRLAEELQSAISTPIEVDGETVSTSISIGIHFENNQSLSFDQSMHKADLALYQAKADGRNTHRFFTDELELGIARRRKVEAAVLNGLNQGLFSLAYQPLLREDSLKCLGFEALLRLVDTDGESIPPEEFIPVAESVGAIGQIGLWVLNTAAEAACTWPAPLTVSVNLSVRQFADGQLAASVKQTLATTGLEPKRLELEITESLLMDASIDADAQLSALRDIGVSIAMDDFGTGYSSLGYLWKYGFDKLKIDRSFVIGIEERDVRAREILETIIVLGHRLNMVVIAEGVENEAQAHILSEMSCDQFQGFLYSRPMPAEDLPGFLLKNATKNSEQGVTGESRYSGPGAGQV
tara:strand:+ start:3416 stop:5419 length:2004 start_codon:yes stop_codon:yes gene_type:complete